MNDDLILFVNKCSEEFDKYHINITVECSIRREIKEEFLEYANNILKTGKWIVYECECCRDFHGDEYVHAEIVRK